MRGEWVRGEWVRGEWVRITLSICVLLRRTDMSLPGGMGRLLPAGWPMARAVCGTEEWRCRFIMKDSWVASSAASVQLQGRGSVAAFSVSVSINRGMDMCQT